MKLRSVPARTMGGRILGDIIVAQQSKDSITLTGVYPARYTRIVGTLAYVLAEGCPDALPQGGACVLPELLGRAVLVREEWVARDMVIMAHELGHVLAHQYGLDKSVYSENESAADRIAVRLATH